LRDGRQRDRLEKAILTVASGRIMADDIWVMDDAAPLGIADVRLWTEPPVEPDDGAVRQMWESFTRAVEAGASLAGTVMFGATRYWFAWFAHLIVSGSKRAHAEVAATSRRPVPCQNAVQGLQAAGFRVVMLLGGTR
jgi:hypothetical protein